MNRQQIKKWSLLRHLNFKGYKRTASGNPLNMVKVMSPSQLTIYGNAVQDGTPSPDAPVEVQLCGDRTGNLLDVSNFTSNSNGYVESGSIYVTGYPYQPGITPEDFLEMTGLKEGDTFTSVADYTQVLPAGGKTQTAQFIKKASAPEDISTLVAFGSEGAISTRIIPAGFNSDNFYPMYIYCGTSTGEGVKAIWSNLAIYKGSYTADTLPAYEPYGYKVSGRAEGLNLLDVSGEASTSVAGATWTINNDGSITVSGTPTAYSGVSFPRMKAKPNTIYTLSTNIEIPNVVGVINFYDADNTMVATNTGTNSSSMLQAVSPEGTTNVTVGFKRNINNVAIPETTFYPMLVQGSYTAETMPPYEPYQPPQDFAVYLPEQIAKVGDVADEVVVDMEKKTAELVRRIERNEFKGTDAWRNDWFPAIVKNLPETAPAIPSARCVSNHFDHNGDTSVPITQIANVVGTTISVARANLISGVTDAETFKTWLSDKNVYAYYPLAEPVTTDITSLQQWDVMPNIEGTVSITFDSTIPISNAEAEYHSKEYDAT